MSEMQPLSLVEAAAEAVPAANEAATASTPAVEPSTAEATPAWACPKDGTTMEPLGRRAGAWRCPSCSAIFVDTEAMRRGRWGQRPVWVPVLFSVLISTLMSVMAAVVVRWLRSRPQT